MATTEIDVTNRREPTSTMARWHPQPGRGPRATAPSTRTWTAASSRAGFAPSPERWGRGRAYAPVKADTPA
jgi:hypothetical protein